MTDREYWKLSEERRRDINKSVSKATEKKCERFYYWEYCRTYGWRQMGTQEGYKLLKQLLEDNKFNIGRVDSSPYRITKSIIWEV